MGGSCPEMEATSWKGVEGKRGLWEGIWGLTTKMKGHLRNRMET